MIPLEILTFAGSTLLGGVLKIWAKKGENERVRLEMAHKGAEFKEASRVRAASVGGPWVRRVIVASVLFSVFIAPFLAAIWLPSIDVSYVYTEDIDRMFFRSDLSKIKFLELKGLVILPIHTHMASSIAGFYFGAGATK